MSQKVWTFSSFSQGLRPGFSGSKCCTRSRGLKKLPPISVGSLDPEFFARYDILQPPAVLLFPSQGRNSESSILSGTFLTNWYAKPSISLMLQTCDAFFLALTNH
jgi:hypothetical protein